MNSQTNKREVIKIKRNKTLSGLMSLFILTVCMGCSGTPQSKPVLKWLVPGQRSNEFDLVERKINEITEKKLGVGVKFDFVPSEYDYANRINAKIESGEEFDLFFTGWIDLYNLKVYDSYFTDLDALLEYAPKLKKEIPEYLWEGTKINGKTYTVPNQQISASSTAVIFDKNLVDKYNFDISAVRSTYDIEPFLKAVKENETDVYPVRMNWGYKGFGSLDDNIHAEMTVGTIDIVNENGVISAKKLTERKDVYKAAKTIYDWYNKGYIRKDAAVAIDSADELAAGKYAVWFEAYKPGVERQRKMMTGNDVYAVQVTEPYMTTNSVQGAMTAISANSKYPIDSLKLLELVNTEPDILNLLTYGIEGKHYEKLSDNVVRRNGNSFSYNTWLFGNQFIIYTDSEQDSDVWEETKRINTSSVKSPLFGWLPDDSGIKDKMNSCTEVGAKYTLISNGTADPETYWEKYDRELDGAGAEVIKRELERQIKEFLAKNEK